MCTLLLAIGQGGTPLMAATNRDERLDRPSEPPSWWPVQPGHPRVWAPRDVSGGGTWIGLNSAGLFVAVTNRFGAGRDLERRSRGLVVLDALSQRTALEAAQVVRAVEPGSVNPFHMVMIDRASAWLVWHDGQALHDEALAPGLHIITERSLGAAEDGRAALLRPRLEALRAQGALEADAMSALLDEHTGRGLDDPCVYVPEWGYGTRSRTLVQLSASPRDTRFEHRELRAQPA
jgi:uncharacterized protein with NRDE domain